MRFFIYLLLLFLCCTKYCTEVRVFGLTETTTIDKKSITNIDTVSNDQGGVMKKITYKEKCR
jgi:hypothetical protein